MNEILKIVVEQLGVKEVVGDEDNEVILKYAEETGIVGVEHDEVPWCSIFVNWCCMKAKLQMSGKANARSWLKVGKSVSSPIPGDVVVFWRESPDSWKGHVSFFLGFNKTSTKVFALGGNQSNSVSIKEYDTKKVLDYRRMTESVTSEIPKPVLKKGSKGTEAKKIADVARPMGI